MTPSIIDTPHSRHVCAITSTQLQRCEHSNNWPLVVSVLGNALKRVARGHRLIPGRQRQLPSPQQPAWRNSSPSLDEHEAQPLPPPPKHHRLNHFIHPQQYHSLQYSAYLCGSMAQWLAHLEFELGDPGRATIPLDSNLEQAVYQHCPRSFSAPVRSKA